MPRDSNGNTNPLPGTIVNQGDTILPSQHNPALVDLYAMMTQSLSRDGQGGMRANLAMSGFQIANLGAATQPGNAVTLSQFQNGTPIGSVIDFAGVTAPDTWLLCFGQAIEVSAYPEFVAACYVGNALNATAGFGYRTTSQTDPAANRSVTGQFITLPDLRGRVGAGKDNMGGVSAQRLTSVITSDTIGASGGSQNIVLTNGQMPSHTHTGTTENSGNHAHPIGRGPNYGTFGVQGSQFIDNSGTTDFAGIHAHNFTTNASGNNEAHPNVQPTLIMNKIIKVSY